MNCVSCGRIVAEGSRSCPACGAIVVSGAAAGGWPAPQPGAAPVTAVIVEHDPGPGRPRRGIWIAAGVAAAAVTVVGAVVALSGGDDSDAASGAGEPTLGLARSIDDELWSVEVEEGSGADVFGGRVFTIRGDHDAELVALSLDSGEELWSTDLDDDGGDVEGEIDGAVLVSVYDDAVEWDESELVAIDQATGEVRWRNGPDDGWVTVWDDRLLLWSYGSSSTEVEILDPATGKRLERFRGEEIVVGDDLLAIVDDEELTRVSLASLKPLGAPVPWDDDLSSPAFVGDHILAINDGDEIVRVGVDGETVWRASVGDDDLPGVTHLGGGYVAVYDGGGDTIVGREQDDGFDELWDTDGWVEGAFRVDGGKLVAPVYEDEDVALVELATGDEMYSAESSSMWVMRDGAIVTVGDESEFSGVSVPSGDELWSFDAEGDDDWIVPFEKGLLRLSFDDDDLTITRVG